MTLDFHTHFHEGQGHVAELLRAMDASGVEMAAVCAVVRPEGDVRAANRLIADVVRAHPDRLVGLACVVPTHPEAAELLRSMVEADGFRGLKLHPSMQRFFPSDPVIEPVIEMAVRLDIPVLVHTTSMPIPNTRSRFDDPLEIDDLALRQPEAKIVMAHGDPLGPAWAIAGKHENVYMDTTTTFARMCRLIPGIGEDTLEQMAMVSGQHGSHKVIFGSDANPLKPEQIADPQYATSARQAAVTPEGCSNFDASRQSRGRDRRRTGHRTRHRSDLCSSRGNTRAHRTGAGRLEQRPIRGSGFWSASFRISCRRQRRGASRCFRR